MLQLLKNVIQNQRIIDELDLLQKKYLELEDLIRKIDQYDIDYYIENQSTIPDFQYDSLKKQMQLMIAEVIDKMNKIENLDLSDLERNGVKRLFSQIKRNLKKRSGKVGAKPSRKFKKVKHKRPMLSLSNCFNEEDVSQFLTRIGKIDKITCELKIDGISFSAVYQNGQLQMALTRGDGEFGEDITLNVKQINDLPHEISYKDTVEIRGEIYMDKTTFSQLSEFATPRNAASGSVRQLDPMITRQRNLKYFVWEVDFKSISSHYDRLALAKELGFRINEYISIASNLSEMISYYEKIANIRSSLDYDIDGVVYKIDDISKQEQLGFTASSPRWATAHKFPSEEAMTHIVDIIIQVGKSGVLIPVAVLEPIKISGTVITRATLHNAGELKRNGYRVGDLVRLVRSGDVIPKITGIITVGDGNSFVMPDKCPFCKSIVIDDTTFTHKLCTGGWRCKGQMIERLKHFVSRDAFNIVGLGNKQIEYFVEEEKITTFADIFKLENNNYSEPLQNKNGWGNKSVSELFKSINHSRKIHFDKFLYSLSIPHVGSEIALLLSKEFKDYHSLVEVINGVDGAEVLQQINGVGIQIAASVVQFFRDKFNLKLVSDLLEEVEIIPYESKLESSTTFAFTGSLTKITRSEAEEFVKSCGSIFSSSVTKKVTYLVVGDKPSSSKIENAKKLNIQFLSEEEFLNLVSFDKFSS